MTFFISRKKLDAEISRRAAEACDQIISEMGAEVHDDLIQKLSIFRLYIDQIERSASSPEIEGLALKMRTEFEQVIRSVKNVSRRLLPTKMEGDTLVDMLEMLRQNMEQPGTGHIHLESKGTVKNFDSMVEMYLLRIIQELIQNAFKHSSAWHVWIRLIWQENLIIEVEDDGSGFSKIPEFIQRLKKKNNTLKMRATVIGASIDYLQGERGLLARIQLPIPSNS